MAAIRRSATSPRTRRWALTPSTSSSTPSAPYKCRRRRSGRSSGRPSRSTRRTQREVGDSLSNQPTAFGGTHRPVQLSLALHLKRRDGGAGRLQAVWGTDRRRKYVRVRIEAVGSTATRPGRRAGHEGRCPRIWRRETLHVHMNSFEDAKDRTNVLEFDASRKLYPLLVPNWLASPRPRSSD